MSDFSRVIYTNFDDPVAYAIMDSVRGQLSDGLWENSSMSGYWLFFDIDSQSNICVSSEIDRRFCGQWIRNKFYDRDDEWIRNWFANKVKDIAKAWIGYYGGQWSRDCTDEVEFFHEVNGGRTEYPTVRDAYRIYDSLKGRTERIPYEASFTAMRKRAYDAEGAIAAYLKELDDDELVEVWNDYCYAINNYDDVIESNDEYTFEDMVADMKSFEVACKIVFGDWNPHHNYVHFDGYGNFESTNNPKDWIYIGDMAREAVASDEDFNDDRIRALLDGEDEEREASRKIVE